VLRLVAEIAVSVDPLDLVGVIPPGLADPIAVQTGRVGDAELRRDVGDDAGGHVGRVGEECPQETDGGELKGQTQAIVLPTAAGDQRAIRVVEVKRARELNGRQLPGVAPIASLLLVRQEIDGHDARLSPSPRPPAGVFLALDVPPIIIARRRHRDGRPSGSPIRP